MNETNDKKAFEIANETAKKNEYVILAQYYLDGLYWFLPFPKKYLGKKKVELYDLGAYTVDPSNNYELIVRGILDYTDAIDNAKEKREIDVPKVGKS